MPLPDDHGQYDTDYPTFNPEPWDEDYETSYVGVHQHCLGAIVVLQDDGRWKCEHGGDTFATDTVAALNCLKNHDEEE